MFDMIALGELLIDFIEEDSIESDKPLFRANPGGAPCNVLAMVSKMGGRTAFIGKVGKDSMGERLKDALHSCKINTDQLFFDEKTPTTLAFVSKDAQGDRSFSFYRNPGADIMLNVDEISFEQIGQSRLFHFGTLSMTHEQNRNVTKRAVAYAKEKGVPISFDPNIREMLWESKASLKEQMIYGFEHCDLLKISEDELLWFTEKKDLSDAIKIFRQTYAIPIIFVTLGARGCILCLKDLEIRHPGYGVSDVVDTTGAGDTFFGAVLGKILEYDFKILSEEEWMDILNYANMAAACIVRRKGALLSMPEPNLIMKELERL